MFNDTQRKLRRKMRDQLNRGTELSLHGWPVDEIPLGLISVYSNELTYIHAAGNEIQIHVQPRPMLSLVCLNLNQNRLNTKSLKHLSKIQLPHLKYLDVGNNRIENQGILHFSKAILPCLQSLNIQKNLVNDFKPLQQMQLLQLAHLTLGELKQFSASNLRKLATPLIRIIIIKVVYGMNDCQFQRLKCAFPKAMILKRR